jgi:hypothetical protein
MNDYGNYREKRSTRDKKLIRALASTLDSQRRAWEKWLQEELIDAIQEIDIIEPTITESYSQVRLKMKLERIREINSREMGEATDELESRCERMYQIEDGDPLDTHFELNEAVHWLARLVREMMELRAYLDYYGSNPVSPDDPGGDGGEEDEGDDWGDGEDEDNNGAGVRV